MLKLTLSVLMLLLANSAQAELETDRIAGDCAGLLSTLKKPAMVAKAINLADNQNRATNFAFAWLDQLKRHVDNKNVVNGMVFSAVRDCDKIGISTSD